MSLIEVERLCPYCEHVETKPFERITGSSVQTHCVKCKNIYIVCGSDEHKRYKIFKQHEDRQFTCSYRQSKINITIKEDYFMWLRELEERAEYSYKKKVKTLEVLNTMHDLERLLPHCNRVVKNDIGYKYLMPDYKEQLDVFLKQASELTESLKHHKEFIEKRNKESTDMDKIINLVLHNTTKPTQPSQSKSITLGEFGMEIVKAVDNLKRTRIDISSLNHKFIQSFRQANEKTIKDKEFGPAKRELAEYIGDSWKLKLKNDRSTENASGFVILNRTWRENTTKGNLQRRKREINYLSDNILSEVLCREIKLEQEQYEKNLTLQLDNEPEQRVKKRVKQ
jgi:hypothetical protein